MNEYILLGHMEEVTYDPNILTYHMPHHCVFKESTTTKLRVIFNASQKTDNGKSLNEQMAMGSLLQSELTKTFLRFRVHKYAFTADVEKMYRQIVINEDQTNLQRIIWRNSTNEPFKDNKLKTITYGTANAPYLAIKTLKQLALDSFDNHKTASEIILSNMYVDDVLAGASSIHDAIYAYKFSGITEIDTRF